MSSKLKKSSLADKIGSLITAAPDNFASDDEAEETRAQVVERYDESDSDDVGVSSSIRKRNIDLLDEVDERYKGKRVTRSELYGDDSDESPDEASDGENSESEDEKEAENSEDSMKAQDEESGDNSSDENSEDDDDSSVDEDNPLRRIRGPETFKNPANLEGDIEKGQAVRQQLKLWEQLLEMRIQLQKCLVASNKLPQFNVQHKFTDKQFIKDKNETTKGLTLLLENLLQVQEGLLKGNSETRHILSKDTKKVNEDNSEDPMDEEIPSDSDEELDEEENEENGEDDENEESEEKSLENSEEPPKKKKRKLEEFETILDHRHNCFKPFRDAVIQKWNDKTRLAAGNAVKGTTQPIVKQIDFLLNDKAKLIKRAQLKRSEYTILGKETIELTDDEGRRMQEHDPEIYDDDDFYHQLLRELIEQKSADITDPIQLSKQWIQLQNMRNKMKRKIDTRATKGRRIRYNVHDKLVNFMAPILVDDTWSDLAKNELYNSLFGKIKAVGT